MVREFFNGLFVIMILVSPICLIIGLIKPSIFNSIFRRELNRKNTSLIFGIAFVVFFILFGVTTPPTSSKPTSAQNSAPVKAVKTAASSAPKTDQQKLDNVVKSLLSNGSYSSELSYKATTIDSDDSVRPAGSKYVTIDINAGTFWDDNSVITDTGTFATSIFQKVFPINPNFYDVLVRYYGQTTDQYGKTTDNMMLSYEMDLPLYNKISWAGFSDMQNDIHLCAFIREEQSTLAESDTDKTYIGCIVTPTNLRSAESKIETGNPQYGDIPQYAN